MRNSLIPEEEDGIKYCPNCKGKLEPYNKEEDPDIYSCYNCESTWRISIK